MRLGDVLGYHRFNVDNDDFHFYAFIDHVVDCESEFDTGFISRQKIATRERWLDEDSGYMGGINYSTQEVDLWYCEVRHD